VHCRNSGLIDLNRDNTTHIGRSYSFRSTKAEMFELKRRRERSCSTSTLIVGRDDLDLIAFELRHAEFLTILCGLRRISLVSVAEDM